MSMSDADPSLELYDYRTTGRHIDIVVMMSGCNFRQAPLAFTCEYLLTLLRARSNVRL